MAGGGSGGGGSVGGGPAGGAGGSSAGGGPVGGAGGAAGITGAAILTVPFQRADQAVELTIAFGDAGQNGGNPLVADLSAATEVRFRLCVAGAPDPENTVLQLVVKDGSIGTRVGAEIPLSASALASCPTMKDVSLPLAGGTLDRLRVMSFSLMLKTSAQASSFASPTVIHLDAVTVTGNVVGPYDFARNTVPLRLRDTQNVGATLRASAPDLSPTASPGGVLVKLPPLTDDRLNFSSFGTSLGGPVDFSTPGTQVTYRVCAVSAPQLGALYVDHFLLDNRNRSALTPMRPLTSVSACPVLTEISFAAADHTPDAGFSLANVNLLGLEIGTATKAADPSVFFVDAIQVTGDLAGPYDFTYNVRALILGYSVAGTALEWASAVPSAR